MFQQAFKNIDDIFHKDAGSTSELDYTGQTSWLLFLEDLERDRAIPAGHKIARILWAMVKYRRPFDLSRLGNP